MMKKMMSLSVMTVALMLPVLANAGNTAQLKLTGTIIPAACTPTFTGGSTIDYGSIMRSTLKEDVQNLLPEKKVELNIICDAPTKFAFKVRDDRSLSGSTTTIEPVPGSANNQKFGLKSLDNTSTIGVYSLRPNSAFGKRDNSGAGGNVTILGSKDGGKAWGSSDKLLSTDEMISFGDAAPYPHYSVRLSFDVVSALDKGGNLSKSDNVAFEGLTMFEVVYI